MKGLLVFSALATGAANASLLFYGNNNSNTTSASSEPSYPEVGATTSQVASVSTQQLTTSTIYTTQIRTVTSCAPEVTNCPGRPSVVTETIAISTTVCPVTEVAEASSTTTKAAETPDTTPGTEASETPKTTVPGTTTQRLTTSTVYTTQVRTVTSCAPDVTNCPNRPHVTTETIAIYTTVCPVTEEEHTSVSTRAFTYQTSQTPSVTFESSQTPSQTFSTAETTKTVETTQTPGTIKTTGSVASLNTTTPATKYTSEWTTSTIYTTTVRTVTSCAPEVTNCPNRPHVTTETIAISTTVCPVTETPLGSTVPVTQKSPTTEVATETPSGTTFSATNKSPTTDVITETTPGTTVPATQKAPTTTVVTETPEASSTKSESHEASTSAWTTSTIYTTQVRTVTSCAPEVTNCPNRPHVTTETIAISTTVCPVTETPLGSTVPATEESQTTAAVTETPKASSTKSESYEVSTSAWTTSTIYTTQIRTVTSCAPDVTNCPNRPHVTTETIAISTTVCPVTETALGSTVPATQKSPTTEVATETTPGTTVPATQKAPTTTVATETPEASSTKSESQEASTSTWTTSTIYTTQVRTITSCAPDVTNCPGKPHVTTETIAISTTVCPVTETPETAAITTHKPETTVIPHTSEASLTKSESREVLTSTWTTSTIYTTQVRTITSCAPDVTNCPGKPHVTTETIAISTTVCPVTETAETTFGAHGSTTKGYGTTVIETTTEGHEAETTQTKTEGIKTTVTKPAHQETTGWTTSTIYTTSTQTITSCAADVTDCPNGSKVVTVTIPVSTTVCPVTAEASTAGASTAEITEVTKPPQQASTTKWTTSTVYTTYTQTIVSCASDVPDCPNRTRVVTKTAAVSTTVCPVTTEAVVTTQPNVIPHTTKLTHLPPYANNTQLVPVSTTKWTTSMIYSTQTRTVSTCAPNVPCTNGPYVTTETIVISSTVCPVTETAVAYPGNSTATLYTTQSYTVTSCSPKNYGCSVGSVATTVYPVGTTRISQWSSAVKPTSVATPAGSKYSTGIYPTNPAAESGSTTPGYEQPTPSRSGSGTASKPTYAGSIGDKIVYAAAVGVDTSTGLEGTAAATASPTQVTSAAGRATVGLEIMTAVMTVIFLCFLN